MRPPRTKPLDQRVAEQAERQLGLVRRSDLTELGVTRAALRHRLASGRWHELHPGVYAVGHRAISRHAEYLAAVWWCGPGSALSHESAAAFKRWIHEDHDHPPPIHVTTTRNRRSRPGVVVHRTRHLDRGDVTRCGQLWVTDDARTLVDLADQLTDDELRKVADQLPRLPVTQLARVASRLRGRAGAGRIQRLIGSEDAQTRSALERRFLAYCEHFDLPHPAERNFRVRGVRVDCWYPGAPLVVELDSRAHHAREAEMETDRRRDRALKRHGIDTLRLMWHDLAVGDPQAAEDLLQRLGLEPQRLLERH